jgi:hypothetical protein
LDQQADFMKLPFHLSYPDLVVNAFRSVQAWKTVSLVLVLCLVFQTYMVVYLAGHQKVLLVPQNLASLTKSVQVNLGLPYAADYLTQVAKGDASALLNWTPANLDTQYGLFIARLTPALATAQKEKLLAEQLRYQQDGVTQSFYVTQSYVKGSEVSLYGVLVRAQAGREVFRGKAAYAFTYVDAGNGMLLVDGVRQPDVNSRPADDNPRTSRASAEQSKK